MKDKYENKSSDILSFYMEEAGKTDLLSREEELELVGVMHKWIDNPKAGEKTRTNGQQARERLIKSNLKLVIKIAKNYRGLGLDFADLIEMEGLLDVFHTGFDQFQSVSNLIVHYFDFFHIQINFVNEFID